MRAPKTQLPLKLEPDLVDRFKVKCRNEGRTQTGTVRLLIQKWLAGKVKL